MMETNLVRVAHDSTESPAVASITVALVARPDVTPCPDLRQATLGPAKRLVQSPLR